MQNAELNERCLKDKEEESRLLQTSVEALQSTLSALENQVCENSKLCTIAVSLVYA
jgi:hypothetical protein